MRVGGSKAEQATKIAQAALVDKPLKDVAALAHEHGLRLYEDLGLIYSIHLKDYQKAAAAYLEGSKNPKAQIYMKVMAAMVADNFSVSTPFTVVLLDTFKSLVGFAATDG